MNLRGSTDLLITLGFERENEEMLTLKDESICNFLEGEPAVDYRRRLAAARLSSEAEYKKELELVQLHKQQRMERIKE